MAAKARAPKSAPTAAPKAVKKPLKKVASPPVKKATAPTATKLSGKALVIVESPAKAKTINKYLGANFTVKASVGHVKDLPKSKMGVDVKNHFAPDYEPIAGKAKILTELRKAAKSVDIVYLAPDPDREGEAIAWHLAEEIRPANSNIKRILFNEITKRGITEALQHPGELNALKFESQQARRILDRLVGYEISPILWKKVRRGLSAGRVQSVAVRIVVDREREIAAFVPVEYWSIEAQLAGKNPPPFVAKLFRVDGKKAEVSDGATAHGIVDNLKKATFTVEKIERKERRRNPLPPFITSKLQQEAARKLRFTAKRTMGVAQRLYEGLELGEEGAVGLITYMRTDSTRLSPDAVTEARDYIAERYGKDTLPDEAVIYRSKKGAQDAHEAIRPTSTKYDPETVKRLLLEGAGKDPQKRRDLEDYYKLYQLIWNRFIACQMKPAVYDSTTVDVTAANATLRATGQVLKFAGYTAVYDESTDEPSAEEDENRLLPELKEGEKVKLLDIKPEQHFTQPPPRFTEASLVKELEEKGIGRPSTYAAIMSTIQDRGYVEKKETRFYPTMLGTKVNDLLVVAFPDVLDIGFTAQMEEDLDKVEDGDVNWVKLLERFWVPFKKVLDKAELNMKDLKREEIPTEHTCEKCGSPMVIKFGRNGEFLACSGYPECKNTKEFRRGDAGEIIIVLPTAVASDEKCEKCGSPMVVKRGRFGEFLACSTYPECKGTKPISLGVDCPKCGGFLTEKRSKRGKTFFGCSNYSKTACDFVTWDRPVAEPCPKCGAKFLVKKESRKGSRVRCIKEGCGYAQEPEAAEEDAA